MIFVAVRSGQQPPAGPLDQLIGQGLMAEQALDGQLDDLRHLIGPGGEARAGGRRADHRAKLEIADRDPDLVQGAGDPDGGPIDPDLLLGLAQRGSFGRGVARIDRATGQ